VLAHPRNVDVYEIRFHALPFDDWMRGLKDVLGAAAIDARIGLLRRGSLGKKYRTIGDGLMS